MPGKLTLFQWQVLKVLSGGRGLTFREVLSALPGRRSSGVTMALKALVKSGHVDLRSSRDGSLWEAFRPKSYEVMHPLLDAPDGAELLRCTACGSGKQDRQARCGDCGGTVILYRRSGRCWWPA